jgi:two-component system, NarL family, uhpT operon response regulator UhpA
VIRMLIGEDHVIVRNSLKKLCELMGDIIVAGEAKNGFEVIELLQERQFDMILLDLNMPDMDGIDLIEHIRARDESLPILIHSMNKEPQVAKRALHAGASGYVAKGMGQDRLMSAICKVAAGERFIDPDIIEAMMAEKQWRGSPE